MVQPARLSGTIELANAASAISHSLQELLNSPVHAQVARAKPRIDVGIALCDHRIRLPQAALLEHLHCPLPLCGYRLAVLPSRYASSLELPTSGMPF